MELAQETPSGTGKVLINFERNTRIDRNLEIEKHRCSINTII